MIRKVLFFLSVLIAAVSVGGCDSVQPAPQSSAGHIPAASATPSLVVIAQPVKTPIGNQAVTARPSWKTGGNQQAFAIDLLRYVQTLARTAKLDVPADGLMYTVLPSADSVIECDPQHHPTTMSGKGSPYAIMWCPKVQAFGVAPRAINELDAAKLNSFYQLVIGFYAVGLAGQSKFGDWLGPEEGACLHGALMRTAVDRGHITNTEAWGVLHNYYGGGTATWTFGYGSGNCKPIEPQR